MMTMMTKGWRYVFRRPKPHRLMVEALKKALKLRRFGLFFQQRVGKTRVAVDYAGIQFLRGKVKRVLVACPKSVREVWAEQITQYLPQDMVHIVEIFHPKRSPEFKEADCLYFMIANYDMIWRYEDFFKKWKPDLVIADEAHLLKSPSSKRSKAMWRIGRNASDRLALTGTPYAKAPTDIFGVARFIDENIYGKSWTKFQERYVVINPYTRGVVGYKNLDELADKIAPYSMRLLREDVGIREPDAETITVRVDLEPKAKKLYNRLASEGIAELESGGKVVAAHVLTQLMRLQQITGGWATTEDGESVRVSTAKTQALRDLVETHTEGGEQVIVVCRFTQDIVACREALGDVRVQVIDGSTKDREKIIRDFQDGNIDVLILQEQVGSMGIDLSAARVMIFYSVDFSLSNYNQMKDRIMGRHQKAATVTYYNIVARNSVDEFVFETLEANEEITSKLANKYREVLKKI